MDNKLSELSKPVAWKLHYYGRGHYFEENAHVVALAESMRKAKGDALYSQEYVSALLAELEAKDKRIAELEKRLTTPVRLPKPCAFNLCDLVDRDAVIASLREQGFTVEGDSE